MKIIPADYKRCQAEKPNGNSFMSLGGVPGMIRCENQPTVIATETGNRKMDWSMSLCDECLAVAEDQLPKGYFTTKLIIDPAKSYSMEEDKMRFLAQYYGQEVLRWHQWISSTPNSIINMDVPGMEKEGWYLQLKSLTNLTDEDAKELQFDLINIIGLDGIIRENSVDLVKELISNYLRVDCLFNLPSSFSDRARYLGYAIDWNGKKVPDLERLGWIKVI